MNPLKWLKGRYLSRISNDARERLKTLPLIGTVDPEDFASSLRDPDSYYRRAFQDFHHTVTEPLRKHRGYFQLERRGFGEDAFHTMWWRLFRKFQPANFLEIGVYRGQVLSLISLLAKIEATGCQVTGISPFSSAGDSVSNYRTDIDYLQDTLANFKHFGLPEPELVNAYSTDQAALEVIRSRAWDMIYIDGNHDYDIVLKDWDVCSKALKPGGIVVLDDSGLTTAYQPPPFATAGHPGPSRLASEIDRAEFEEILQVGHNRVFRKAIQA